jgi:hypothetical protein
MNIDDLTIGQVKDLAALFAAPSKSSEKHPFIGKYVICRCSAAGVHAGTLASVDGDAVILSDSRRLWSWTAVEGVALSGVAQHGIKAGKIDSVNPEIYLLGMCEIIPCSTVAKESIENA